MPNPPEAPSLAALEMENRRLSEACAAYHKLTERQRAEIERLREALNGVIPFVSPSYTTDWRECDTALIKARAALEQE